MFSKGRLTAACLLVLMTAFVAWAAAWQIQTRMTTVGGTIQVETKAVQTGATLYYNTMADTLPDADVTVNANSGYEIATITRNGQNVSGVAGQATYTTNFVKSASPQGLVASFRAKQLTVSGSNDGPGTVSPATSLVPAGSSVRFTATPTTVNTAITAITVNGAPFTGLALPASGINTFTVSNIAASSNVVVTFVPATANAGANKAVVYNVPTTLDGSASGPGTIVWTQTSGPAVVLSNADTATPSFTPAATGTYGFKLAKMNGTTVLASSTTTVTAVTDLVSYMNSTCNGCHSPVGMVPSNSFAQWKASKHVNSSITCTTCHTDGSMPSPVNTKTVDTTFFNVSSASAGTYGTVYCDKCHNGVRTAVHSTAVVEVNVCSKCHDPHYFNDNGKHHFAGLATPASGAVADGTSRTAYVTQGATCADCHNAASNYINKGYAEGGHGQVSDEALNAFTHYDWSASNRKNAVLRGGSNCVRCHTTGGFAQFLGDTDAYNKFKPVTGVQNVLGCQSCHTSNYATGELRTAAVPAGLTAPLTSGYFALFSSALRSTGAQGQVAAGKTKIQVEFPGMKNSSICIPCHSGRSTDDVFVAVIDQAAEINTATGLPWGNYSTVGTSYYQHAANMGQSFIGKGAFNFNSGEYVGSNGHAAVANGAADTQGPCVGCHYSKAGETHSLQPVGYTAVCQQCHQAPFGATDVEEKKAEFDAGVKVLDALIRAKFAPLQTKVGGDLAEERVSVRFGRFGAVDQTTGAPAAATADAAKKAYGAWYNWQLLTAWDKAAFVHNPTFARTVLMDTIDYLDGYVGKDRNGKFVYIGLDGSAAATIAASTAVTAAEKTAATEFLETPACASCHAAKATLVQSGKHAAEVSTHSGSCGRCHTTEGYVAFLAGPEGANPAVVSTTSYNGSQNVSCAACHDTHGATTPRNVAWAPQPAGTSVAASAEYKLCTSCHNLTNAAGGIMASGLTVNGQATVAMQQHSKDWDRNIASTHMDLSTTGFGLSNTTIEGYNVRFNSETACRDCHGHEFYTNSLKALEAPSATDPDKGKMTIQTEWAASGHAGKLLKAKFGAFTTAGVARAKTPASSAAVMAAGVTGASGPAWEHYDWDNATGTGNDRKACQKCHTATGSSNFLNDPTTYNAANNDFSHLSGWTATNKTSAQNEVLYCWGCHNNAETGALRIPAAGIPADYKFNGANFNFPNVGASTVCFGCHGGRVGGDNIKALTTAGNTFTAVGFQNSHYMAAAGLMYVKGGYTNFIDPATVIGSSTYGKSLTSTDDGGAIGSTHRKLGTAAMATDSHVGGRGLIAGGPCATCHYANGNHELELGKDAFEKVCVNCHTAEGAVTLTAENYKEFFVEEQAAPFQDALALAIATLKTKYNITYDAAVNPYFFDDAAFPGQPHASATQVKDWTRGGALSALEAEKLMGACFNINLLNREPAAYVHARTYTRRLIYDSIDFLDDKAINMSVIATATAWNPTKYVVGTGPKDAATTAAALYLKGAPYGSSTWATLERP